jgi:hypothetical protein
LGAKAKIHVIAVKVSLEEKRAWKRKAKAAGMGLTPWLLLPRRQEREAGS